MAKLYIPFEVNNKKFITLEFDNDGKYEQKEIICEMAQAGQLQLLRFRGKLHATSNLNRMRDLDVSLQEINYSVSKKTENEKPIEENVELIFTQDLPPIKKKKPSKKNEEQESEEASKLQEEWVMNKMSCTPKFETKNDRATQTIEAWKLQREHADSYRKINITLVVQDPSSDLPYEAKVVCHLIPRNAFYELALDFGSEASQMKIICPNDDRKAPTSIPILEKAKNRLPEFEAYKEMESSSFHQYVPDKENLFQSLFYIERQDADDKLGRPVFLSKIKEDEKYSELMPSLKIALLDNTDTRGFLTYYRMVINNFLRTAIAAISEKEELLPDHIGLQINLLVPNVMNIGNVNKLIDQILSGFSYLQDNNPELYGKFHLEITPISESDASFAGYFEANKGQPFIQPNKNYLIIDGGKGTMDFSIIRIEDKDNYESRYRNGFIGSGNAITYAIFDHLCAIIKDSPENEGRKKLMQDILFNKKNDQVGRKKLLEVLEKIKKAYSNSPSDQIEKNCNKLNDLFSGQDTTELTAGGLAAKLEEEELIGSFGDKYGIIHATCYNICSSLSYNLMRNNISTPEREKIQNTGADIFFDEVILAGRTFMFKMLKDELKRVLKEEWHFTKKIEYDSKEAKEACLNGALAWNFVNCNSGLSGIPCKALACGPSQKPIKQENNHWEILFKPRSGGSTLRHQTLKNFEINEDFLMNGFDIELEANEDLKMNGFELEDRNANKADRKYNFYYTEKGILLRNEGNVYTPILNNRLKETNVAEKLLFASRFPRYDNANDKANLCLWELPVL